MQVAGIAAKFQPTDTDSLIEKRLQLNKELEEEEEEGDTVSSVNVHAPNDPKFLFNARASVFSFLNI